MHTVWLPLAFQLGNSLRTDPSPAPYTCSHHHYRSAACSRWTSWTRVSTLNRTAPPAPSRLQLKQ